MLVREKHDRAINCVFCRDFHLKLMLSGLYKKNLFKGEWSLAKSYFKQNYCHTCQTRFVVFFLLPSCCVSSLEKDGYRAAITPSFNILIQVYPSLLEVYDDSDEERHNTNTTQILFHATEKKHEKKRRPDFLNHRLPENDTQISWYVDRRCNTLLLQHQQIQSLNWSKGRMVAVSLGFCKALWMRK